MPEEYEEEDSTYSAFWPILIFMTAFALSCFYQLYQVVEQRSFYENRYALEAPNLGKAQEVQDRFNALVNDLVATAGRDPNAAQIIREAVAAGILHPRSNSSSSTSGTTNAAPATGP